MPNDSKPIAVKLPAKDWSDLVNFIGGDLANMPENDPVRVQMDRICEVIRERLATG